LPAHCFKRSQGFIFPCALCGLCEILEDFGVSEADVGALVKWLFVFMLWLSFGVVRHADCLAVILGEPYAAWNG
jgi:hypothetical protein